MKNSFVIFVILIFTSCLSEQEKIEKSKIKLADVQKLGQALHDSYLAEDQRAINDLYDELALANRFLTKSSQDKFLEFNKGFYIGFARQFNFGEILMTAKSDGASYDFLRTYQDKDNNFHLLFRFFGADGINYHDHLVKRVKNKLKIVDTYLYLSSEYLSETYKTIYKNALYRSDFFSKDMSKSRFVKDLQKLNKMKSLNANGNFKAAHKIYKIISNTSKQEKIFKLVNLTTSSNLSEKIYEEALQDYQDKFPDDPSLELISTNYFITKGKFDKALLAIDNLENHVKGDPFLNYLRANVLFMKKDYKNALQKYDTVTKTHPEFYDAYDGVLTVYMTTNQNKKAIATLDTLTTKFVVSKDEIKTNLKNSFPNFVKTRAFQKWESTQ